MTLTILLLAAQVSLPNPVLTPGVIRPLTLKTVCETRWSLDRRHVTEKMKKQVAAAYGVPWANRRHYEFDHRVPRALSGDDKMPNLWPEPLWEAKHLKDPLEVKLWRMVCAGELALNEAQAAFMTDWRVSYRRYIGELPKRSE